MASNGANLNDVADRAGVSKSTVSRVLNNKLGGGFSVTEAVRQRVITAAQELNYRPNLIAQSLTQQNFRMISVLGGGAALSDLGNIYQTVVNNITEVIDSVDTSFDVMVDMSRHEPDSSELPGWKIDGAVVLARCNMATYEHLRQGKVPFVVVNGASPFPCSSVVPDDVEGTKTAMSHLFELGHQRIAYAGPRVKHTAGHSSLADRHDTYISEMKKLRLRAITGHDALLDSAATFLKKTVLKQKATAILAYGHMEALNLMQAAHTLDIAIPDQLSLICFCDEYACSVMSPGLSFMDLQSHKMGKIAAEMLLGQINATRQPRHKTIKLKENLIVRESTAVPNK